MNADISTLEEAEDVLMGDEDLYLLAEDGTCVSLKGEPIVFSSTDILQELCHSAGISSDFRTVQTKGDFWIFFRSVPCYDRGQRDSRVSKAGRFRELRRYHRYHYL